MREINFRHVVEPLNLLILMAEVFFSLCVCFFFSRFLGRRQRVWGQGCQAGAQTEPSTSLPLWHQHLHPSLSPHIFCFVSVCVPLFNYNQFWATCLNQDRKKKKTHSCGEKVCACVRVCVFLISDQSHPCPQPPPSSLFSCVYLEVPVHNLGWMQVVESWDNLGAVEARALLREHSFSGQMEKQLQEKQIGREREKDETERQQGRRSNNYWFIGGN